jgi:hypothetical protein
MAQQRVRLQKTKRSSRTATDTDQTPATDRREIRKDIRRVWFPDA